MSSVSCVRVAGRGAGGRSGARPRAGPDGSPAGTALIGSLLRSECRGRGRPGSQGFYHVGAFFIRARFHCSEGRPHAIGAAVHGVSPRSRRTIPAPSLNGRSTLPILPARSRNPGHAESSVTNRRRTIAEGGRPAARTMLRRGLMSVVGGREIAEVRRHDLRAVGAGGERPGPVVAARRPRGVAAEVMGPRTRRQVMVSSPPCAATAGTTSGRAADGRRRRGARRRRPPDPASG